MSALLSQYKAFVRRHPSLVQNAERLLHWLVWNPERFSGSEYAYESFNAAVGLLGIYNDAILSDHPGQQQDVANWAFWLAAVEQIQTLIELRAIHLEERGKMSRYSPLIALELLKCGLRLALWQASKCTLAMQDVTRDDQEQHECQQQLKELLQALTRLRQRYMDPSAEPTAEHMQFNAHLAHASAVRAAAVAPHRPPAACSAAAAAAVGDAVLPGVPLVQQQQQQGTSSSSKAARCAVCGSAQDSTGTSSSCSSLASTQQQQQQKQQPPSCKVCGRPLLASWGSDVSSSAGGGSSGGSAATQPLPGLTEITPVDPQQADSAAKGGLSATAGGSSGGWAGAAKQLQQGLWRRATSVLGRSSKQQQPQQQGQQQPEGAGPGSFAGALPGSWGPSLRPYPALNPVSSKAEQAWQQQHQQPQWVLSPRDASIGQSVMWVGECVHVIRPLLYVIMLRRYGLKSWKPWLTMLALDAAAGYGLHTGHAILVRSNASKWPAGSTLFSLALLRSLSSGQWSPGEQQELLARRLQLLRYLLRDPCYTAFTRHLLLKVVAGSRWMPGVSSLAEFAFSMIEGMQSYYTYVES